MDLSKSGGPAYPTLNGAKIDDNTFRFEGMTIFDFYIAHRTVEGKSPMAAVKDAARVLEYRNAHLVDE